MAFRKKLKVVGIDTNRSGERVWRCDGDTAFEDSLWQEGELVHCVEGDYRGLAGIKVGDVIYMMGPERATFLSVRI